MNNKLIKTVIIALSVVATLSALGLNNIQTDGSHSSRVLLGSSKKQIVSASASYPVYHADLKSLYKDADVVAYGKVTKVRPSRMDSRKLVFTDSEVKVLKYYKNPQVSADIIVQQDGGTVGNTEYRLEDITLFNEGEEYILFLKKISDNKYFVLSPVAQYKIQNGQAKHLESTRNKDFVALEQEIEAVKNQK